jgi:putative oxidoreductase
MRVIDNICLLLGRLLMGTYFILPGLMKTSNY